MLKIVIYYQQKECEMLDHAISFVNKIIGSLQKTHEILGVFFDHYGEREEFYNFINSNPKQVDVIFLTKSLEDEFDQRLLEEFARAEKIQIKFIHDEG
ncbi:hypothetical protein [Peribacillus glennii]|uniref:Uncharacterized protein n=1 Tax=Peribacillus glennii TaxID=2303991 RepID=A0A372LGC2_9BACI|nr:hypothetical protein [Peribacillus glennii]RFU65119.1 hypothetical protein D0466_04200 [Peribacillus glennii]